MNDRVLLWGFVHVWMNLKKVTDFFIRTTDS